MLNSRKEEIELFSNDFSKKKICCLMIFPFLNYRIMLLILIPMNEDNQNDKFDKNYQGISPNNFSFFSFPLNQFEFSNSITGKTESNSSVIFQIEKETEEK